MDRKAFKQRMQNLKSYRESNPDKGYWDWKVQSYEDGGEAGDPSIWSVLKHNANAALSAIKRKMSNDREESNAEVIDLTNKNMQRITPSTSNVSTILVNEFVEDNPNNIRRARDFKNTTDTLIGDRKIPLSKISQFYGIEDGKLKAGDLQNFNDTTTVVPIRNKNIGKVVEYIPGKMTPEDEERQIKISRDALMLSYKQLADEYGLDYGNNVFTRMFYGSPYSQTTKLSRTNKELRKKMDYYRNRHLDRIKNIDVGSKVVTQEGDTIPTFKGNINNRGKILFADEDGNSVFVNNLGGLNQDNVKQLNQALDKGLYPVKVDNGRYEHYQTSTPDYHTYTALDFYRDPASLYVVGSVDGYAEGGEIPPTRPEPMERIPYKGKLYTDKLGRKYTEQQYQDYLQNSSDEISKFDEQPIVRGLNSVIDIEDAANFTPLGDAITVKDTYDAIKSKDWLGAGAGLLGLLPFVPNVTKYFKKADRIGRDIGPVRRQFEEQLNARDFQKDFNKRRITEEYLDQRNRSIELMYTPEAKRRAAKIDNEYGTEYSKVYDDMLKRYEDIDEYVNMPDPVYTKGEDYYAQIIPDQDDVIRISEKNVQKPTDMPMGLVRHELGHRVDALAYPGGINNNAYLRDLARPSKFEPFNPVKHMFGRDSVEEAKSYYDYLRTPSEKKSIMNEFDQYLMNTYTPSTYPTTLKEFREAVIKAPNKEGQHMRDLLKLHVKPSILFKDFKARPLVNSKSNNKNLA